MNESQTKQFRLSDDDLQTLDAMEQEGVGQDALDPFLRYLGATMGFVFDAKCNSVIVTDANGGEFTALPRTREIAKCRVETWTEFLGSEDGKFARVMGGGFVSDGVICWTEGMVGIYPDMDAFENGEGVMVLV